MKKPKRKQPEPKNDAELSAIVEPELNELIAGIENEIKTVQHLNMDDPLSFEKGENLVDIGRHICVELEGRQFAIPLSSVQEAGEHIPVQPLPLLPDWITGITNIRGEIISVINLTLFFNIKSVLPRMRHMQVGTEPYLIVHNADIKTAIIVNRILATRPLYSLITQKPKTEIQKKDMLSKHFSGHAFYEKESIQKEIFLFDLDKFLSSSNLYDFSIA